MKGSYDGSNFRTPDRPSIGQPSCCSGRAQKKSYSSVVDIVQHIHKNRQDIQNLHHQAPTSLKREARFKEVSSNHLAHIKEILKSKVESLTLAKTRSNFDVNNVSSVIIDRGTTKVNNNNYQNVKNSNSNDDERMRDVDCGYAWIVLAVMFVINASTFGTARAYGLIFDKLARQDEQKRAQAALPFTIMGAIECMGGPLTGYLLARTQSWRFTVFLGSCLITLSHVLAAFCDSQLGQILSMGLMCGLGQSFITMSSFQINNAYFVRYRSRAFGLGLTGAVFGTFYISPMCHYALKYHTTRTCYLMLGLILLPNAFLSLLLKPKKSPQPPAPQGDTNLCTVSKQVESQRANKVNIWLSICRVITTPVFHLIWPTQLLFCWFNFVFGMIIVDFSKDRGLDPVHASHLISIWAFGQLVGRLGLGSLVDLKLLSYKTFTVICFASISLATWALNNVHIRDHEDVLLSILVFILSMFISNLYILFNGLVVNYMDKSLTTLSIGISSFTGSFFLLPRAEIIGYYRDEVGNYDPMLTIFTYISMAAALIWLLMPILCSRLRSLYQILAPSMTAGLVEGLTIYSQHMTSLKIDVKYVGHPAPTR